MDPGALQPLNLGALFLLGLLGSGHCVGMCGPLVMAFPARASSRAAHFAYHLGRLSTYALMGAILGSLGMGLARFGAGGSFVWTARIQIGLSIVAAVFLALFGLSKLGLLKEPRLLALANPGRIPGFSAIAKRLGNKDLPSSGPALTSLFLLGLALGLLPCGLSFAAFARSLSAASPLEGAMMTASFGLGTLPSLLLVGFSASKLTARHRRASDIVAGMLMIGMAVSLLLALL